MENHACLYPWRQTWVFVLGSILELAAHLHAHSIKGFKVQAQLIIIHDCTIGCVIALLLSTGRYRPIHFNRIVNSWDGIHLFVLGREGAEALFWNPYQPPEINPGSWTGMDQKNKKIWLIKSKI